MCPIHRWADWLAVVAALAALSPFNAPFYFDTQAMLDVGDSVRGILRVISSLCEEHAGRVVDWQGRPVPW